MISISIVLLFLIGILLYLLKKKMIFFLVPVVLALIVGVSFKIVKGYFPMPNGVRHLLHLLSPPNDLYEPVIKDKFLFFEKGYSKTYSFNPKYFDFYDCGFSISEDLPDNYKYDGELRIEFYSKNELLLEKTVNSWDTMGRKEVSLYHFEVPIKGKHFKDVEIKLTVIKPDLKLLKYKDSLEMFVGVSGTP